jgi:diguanylate cyclase (GGDEF)-like protein
MEDGKPREVDIFLHHADGHRVPVLVRAVPVRDAQGDIIGAVETFSRDMGTIAVRQELRELRRSVHTDKLTGIGNRRFLDGRLRAVIAEFEHQTDTVAGLLFMDIDDFKQSNDTYGHVVGDKLLRMVASTLRNNLRQSDVVGRWGGDEFLAILYDLTSAEELRVISEKLRILIESSRLDLAAQSLTVTVSGGATLVRTNDTPEAISRRADELMYQSKQSGGNQIRL